MGLSLLASVRTTKQRSQSSANLESPKVGTVSRFSEESSVQNDGGLKVGPSPCGFAAKHPEVYALGFPTFAGRMRDGHSCKETLGACL